MAGRILFVRSLPLERDARSSKMVAEYRRRGYAVTSVIWSRGDAPSVAVNVVTCTAQGGYGRGLRGLGARLIWMWFLAIHMVRRRGTYDIVHVVDLDTGIVGVPLAILLRKPVIYDAFDHIGAIAAGWVGRWLAAVERWAIGHAAIAIFPDPIRLEQYGVTPSDTIRIIGNIPDLHVLPDHAVLQPEAGPLRLIYIGTLEAKHRGLEYLPTICADSSDAVEVIVGGTGELHEYFVKASGQLANLTYIGQQNYDDALLRMTEADCLFGPYLLSAPAHRFASPNKMYEHLALGKPLITNSGTPPATLVERLGSGFLFDGTLDGLNCLLTDLSRSACRAAGRRAALAWRRNFSDLRQKQLDLFFDRLDLTDRTPA